MANANVLLDAASGQIIDLATNTYRVNFPFGTITFPSAVNEYRPFEGITNGVGSTVTFPTVPCWVVYVKNLDPSATVTVIATVVGGATPLAANSPLLNPGGVWIYWNATETPAGGLVALSLVSSVVNSYVEILLAG